MVTIPVSAFSGHKDLLSAHQAVALNVRFFCGELAQRETRAGDSVPHVAPVVADMVNLAEMLSTA